MLSFKKLGAQIPDLRPTEVLVLSFRLDRAKAYASVAQADQECAFSITY